MDAVKDYALITGATSGIGLELSRLFAQDGYKLILVARDLEELKVRAQELGNLSPDVQVIAKDLSIKEEVLALCLEIKERQFQVEILVNDAGQGLYGKFKDTDLERELAMISLNCSAVVMLTKHFLGEMVAAGKGKILFLASIASKSPGPWQSVYHATKAFVLSFAEAIRYELKDQNITITALMPGVTDTDFFTKAEMLDSQIIQDKDSMADPAVVAKDGFEALMAGKDKVVSGFKNKMQVAMTNLIPDSTVAAMMGEQQKPVE